MAAPGFFTYTYGAKHCFFNPHKGLKALYDYVCPTSQNRHMCSPYSVQTSSPSFALVDAKLEPPTAESNSATGHSELPLETCRTKSYNLIRHPFLLTALYSREVQDHGWSGSFSTMSLPTPRPLLHMSKGRLGDLPVYRSNGCEVCRPPV